MLNAFSSFNQLQKMPRRHAVTFKDVMIPGENYSDLFLPVSGTQLSFDIPLGPSPPTTWKGELVIEVEGLHLDEKVATVAVNAVEGQVQNNETMKNGHHRVTYTFPMNAISEEYRDTVKKHDVITVTAEGREPITVHRVEVSLNP
jgi:hypothetical protein